MKKVTYSVAYAAYLCGDRVLVNRAHDLSGAIPQLVLWQLFDDDDDTFQKDTAAFARRWNCELAFYIK